MRSLSWSHNQCFACGRSEAGLHLRFEQFGEDSVRAEWNCDECYQSYPGIIHGGIIATMLDSAMTNCLLAKGIEAVTADLHIRYHKSLCVGKMVEVTARLAASKAGMFVLESEIRQDASIAATAQGKFMKRRSNGGSDV